MPVDALFISDFVMICLVIKCKSLKLQIRNGYGVNLTPLRCHFGGTGCNPPLVLNPVWC